jgi:hypothetical protein
MLWFTLTWASPWGLRPCVPCLPGLRVRQGWAGLGQVELQWVQSRECALEPPPQPVPLVTVIRAMKFYKRQCKPPTSGAVGVVHRKEERRADEQPNWKACDKHPEDLLLRMGRPSDWVYTEPPHIHA